LFDSGGKKWDNSVKRFRIDAISEPFYLRLKYLLNQLVSSKGKFTPLFNFSTGFKLN
jgi:hypothetical protein